MDTPAVIIKFKGAQAANLLAGNAKALGAVKLKGASALFGSSQAARGLDFEAARMGGGKLGSSALGSKGVMARSVELEGARLVTTKKGTVLYATKISRGCEVVAFPGGAKAGIGGAKAGIGGAKAAAVAAKGGAACASSGTIWSGTGLGLGLGLGLGGWGPALLLGTAGLVATGVYLYRRNREIEEDEFATDAVEDAIFED